MLIRTINIILLLVIFGYGQSKVKWRDLAPATQKTISDLAADSAVSVIQDSISFPVDTLALKLLNMDEGRVAYLKEPAGWWTVKDSTYNESKCVIAAPHLTSGLQWTRDIYHVRKTIYSDWAPTLADAFAVLSDGDEMFVNGGRYTVTTKIPIAADDINIVFAKDAVIFKAESTPRAAEFMFSIDGSIGGTWYDIADSIETGTDTLILSSGGSNFSEGNWIVLFDSTDGRIYATEHTEVLSIREISGDTIFTVMGCTRPHKASVTSINTFSPRENITITSGRFVSDYTTGLAATQNAADSNRVYAFEIDNALNVKFYDCISDSNAGLHHAEWYVRFLEFHNCIFKNSRDDGYIYRTQNWVFSYCKAYNLDVYSIGGVYSDIGFIDHCYIGSSFDSQTGIALQESRYVITSNNTIMGKPMNYGISYNVDCDYGKIHHNTIVGASDYGITTTASYHIQVQHNLVQEQGDAAAFHFDDCSNTDIKFNKVIDAHRISNLNIAGISVTPGNNLGSNLSHNRVIGNYLEDLTGYAIGLASAIGKTDTVEYAVVIDNKIVNASRGILIGQHVRNTTYKNNQINYTVGWGRTNSAVNNRDSLIVGDGVWESAEIDLTTGDTVIMGVADCDASLLKYEVLITDSLGIADTTLWKLGVLEDNDAFDIDSLYGGHPVGTKKYWKNYATGSDARTFGVKNAERGEPIMLSVQAGMAAKGKAIFRVYYANWQ